ncbi:MAG TPA: SIS domain-containing protein [Reyranella sp.]|jgi:fructoselysine-6-P-deglycase FrlB-like protein|nr:SIS domain-containing protein [Reyranella sp.]
MPIPAFIREQPAALDRCMAAMQDFAGTWKPRAFDGIALVGTGSSYNALTVARRRFVTARRGPVSLHQPDDFIAELADAAANPLVIVLSQSGASATSIAAAHAAVLAGLPTLAITASFNSLLARAGADVLHLPVGPEPVGPKTKGFLGSMAVLLQIAELLGAPAMQAMTGAALASLIEPARLAAAALVPSLSEVDQIIVAGRAANYGVALEATLKITEMAGIPTSALPTEELLHGRLHGMTERSIALIIADGESERTEARRARDVMARRNCRIEVIERSSALWPADSLPPSPWNALGLILPFQWLAVLLAEACGLRPEAMRHGSLSPELAIKTDPQP